jgi:hypothetical protein
MIEGRNQLTGKRLAVYGTPHFNETVYRLYARTLGIQVKDDDVGFQYEMVQRNGFQFWFNTWSRNELLRELQLSLIESELLQAVGRARVLTIDVDAHLFSNLPIYGCVIDE